MARILTTGFEAAAFSTVSAAIDAPLGATAASTGVRTYDTVSQRTGTGCLKVDSGASNGTNSIAVLSGMASSATYYARGYFRFPALPSTAAKILGTASAAAFSVRLTTSGKLQLWNDVAATQIGSDSAATIALNTYYRVEVKAVTGSGSLITDIELRLDGTTVASVSGVSLSSSKAVLGFGWVTAPGTNKVLYLDDVAVNTGAGAANNSWPGEGAAVLLLPTADSAGGTGWTLGTGTALGGNAFQAVNNVPPVGVADLTAGSDPKQIRNAASAANSNLDVTLASYTAGGVPSGATVNAVIPWTATAAPVTTSAKLGTVGVVSNPTIANVALSATGTAGAFWSGVAAGAFPTGWKWSPGTATDAPSVTLGTAPVMRVTQSTASTRIAMVSFVGLYVDYTPGVSGTNWTQPVTDPLSLTDSQAFQRDVTLPLADTLSLADLVAAQRGIAQAVADTLALADLASTAAGKGVTLADTLALADAATSQAAFVRGLADTLSLADTLAAQSTFQLAIVDTLALADTLASQAAFVRALADTLTLADLASPVESEGGIDHTQPIADTLALADALTAGSTLARALADTLTLADSLTAQKTILRDLADTVAIADTFRFSRDLGLTDTLQLVDTVSFQAAYLRTLADTVALADTVTASRVLTQAVADLLTLADSLTSTTGRGLLLEDIFVVADLLETVFTAAIGEQPPAGTITFPSLGGLTRASRGPRITQPTHGARTRADRGKTDTPRGGVLTKTARGDVS